MRAAVKIMKHLILPSVEVLPSFVLPSEKQQLVSAAALQKAAAEISQLVTETVEHQICCFSIFYFILFYLLFPFEVINTMLTPSEVIRDGGSGGLSVCLPSGSLEPKLSVKAKAACQTNALAFYTLCFLFLCHLWKNS